MAKPLIVVHDGLEISLLLDKVERGDLYGAVEMEAYDMSDRPARTASLLSDGRTLVGKGGTALGYLDPDGCWESRAELRPVTVDGELLVASPSSFSAPIPLDTEATPDEYLEHKVRAVYAVQPEGDGADQLSLALSSGKIYRFPFSYRGGIAPDVGFLLANPAGEAFLALGKPTKLEWVGFAEAAALADTPVDDDDADDDIDFGIL